MDWREYKQLFVMIVMLVSLEKQVVPDRNIMNSTVGLSPMDQTSRFIFGQVLLKTCRLRDVIPDSAITNRMANMEDHLIDALSRASSVDMAVSLLRESGYTILGKPLSEALSRGAQVRILTGTYLGITSPFVLEELMNLKGDIEIRLFSEPNVSFHPKSYIFNYPDRKDDVIYIGSSDLSASALSTGVEWNYRLMRSIDRTSLEGSRRSSTVGSHSNPYRWTRKLWTSTVHHGRSPQSLQRCSIRIFRLRAVLRSAP